MSNAKHTPTPYKAEPYGKHRSIVYQEGATACAPDFCAEVSGDKHAANVAFIVRACNAHEASVEAMESALAWMLECEAETGKPMGAGLGYKGRMHKPIVAEKLRAALELAKTGKEG